MSSSEIDKTYSYSHETTRYYSEDLIAWYSIFYGRFGSPAGP